MGVAPLVGRLRSSIHSYRALMCTCCQCSCKWRASRMQSGRARTSALSVLLEPHNAQARGSSRTLRSADRPSLPLRVLPASSARVQQDRDGAHLAGLCETTNKCRSISCVCCSEGQSVSKVRSVSTGFGLVCRWKSKSDVRARVRESGAEEWHISGLTRYM